MTRTLTVVPPAADTPAARAARLQTEMKAVALDAYSALLATLDLAVQQAREVEGLTALPHGVRDEARRLADEIVKRSNHMTSIKERV